MADFEAAFVRVMKAEGGYDNDPADSGGETYKGIARKKNPGWDGWPIVDAARKDANFPASLARDASLQDKIKDFYRRNYWDDVRGNDLKDQRIAECLFDFAVNAGTGVSSKVAQMTVGPSRTVLLAR